MTTTTAATATTGTSLHMTTSTTGTAPTQDFNSDLFLKLLTTQLANQDPSSPMDSGQMVEQTSQLASMEQLTSMNKTVSSSLTSQMQATATSMLGRTVSWTDADGVAKSGVVSSISFSSTTDPALTVGSSTVNLSDVTGVTTTATAA
jgi:flagellar basal-body rod modification protein FlgD